jgi:hypothetical protein
MDVAPGVDDGWPVGAGAPVCVLGLAALGALPVWARALAPVRRAIIVPARIPVFNIAVSPLAIAGCLRNEPPGAPVPGDFEKSVSKRGGGDSPDSRPLSAGA